MSEETSAPTVMGLPIEGMQGEQSLMPLAAVVLLKCLDEEGKLTYMVRATDDITTIEAIGLVHYAVAQLSADLGE